MATVAEMIGTRLAELWISLTKLRSILSWLTGAACSRLREE